MKNKFLDLIKIDLCSLSQKSTICPKSTKIQILEWLTFYRLGWVDFYSNLNSVCQDLLFGQKMGFRDRVRLLNLGSLCSQLRRANFRVLEQFENGFFWAGLQFVLLFISTAQKNRMKIITLHMSNTSQSPLHVFKSS